ncbi:SCO1431 family membrane protein [Streptomyces sp. CA-288835]|uniref:SCO1431 family membrane protein n=1 Tax=Streptomyces sp. CA-288835 TaxID=3240069 RepID=UPI003D931862
MTANSATAGRLQTGRPQTRTGGPDDDGPKIVEHLAGWTLVVVLAMLVTQLGMI